MTREFSRILLSAEETENFAINIAASCKRGDCLLLYGGLGAGKTTFARAFIRKLTAITEEITSPTFTLVQTYPLPQGADLWHCDLYRLESEAELPELGLEDAFSDNIVLIEWPEIAENYLPNDALKIKLEIVDGGRRITVSGNEDIIGKIEKYDTAC